MHNDPETSRQQPQQKNAENAANVEDGHKPSSEKKPPRDLAGRLLSRAGLLTIPMTAGATLGFWLADRGIPWMPHMLEMILGALVFALLAIPAGYMLRGRALTSTPGNRKLRRRIIAMLILAALCVAGRLSLHWVERPSPLTALTEMDFNSAYEIDLERFSDYRQSLEKSVSYLESRRDIFPAENPRVLTPEQESDLRQTWKSIWDCGFALDQIRVAPPG